jgi:hypothetical protein
MDGKIHLRAEMSRYSINQLLFGRMRTCIDLFIQKKISFKIIQDSKEQRKGKHLMQKQDPQ